MTVHLCADEDCRKPFDRIFPRQKYCKRKACIKRRERKAEKARIAKRTYICKHCKSKRLNQNSGPNPLYCPDKPECQEARRRYINDKAVANRNEWAGHTAARKDNKRNMDKRFCVRCKKWKKGTFYNRCPDCVEKQSSIYWHIDEQAGLVL